MIGRQIAFLIMLLVFSPIAAYQVFWFVKLRKSVYIRSRGYYSVLTTGLGFMMISYGLALASVANLPCIVGAIAVYFGAPLTALSFVERSVLLYFCFIITQKAEDLANEKFGLTVGSKNKNFSAKVFDFLLNYRKYFSYKLAFINPVRVVALSIAVMISMIGIIKLETTADIKALDYNWWDKECQIGVLSAFKPVLICIYVVSVLRIYVTIKLKGTKENFGINVELRRMALIILMIAGYLTYVVFWTESALEALPDFITISYLPFAFLLPQLAIFVCFGTVLLKIRSIHIQRRQRQQSESSYKELESPRSRSNLTESGNPGESSSRVGTLNKAPGGVKFKPTAEFQNVLDQPELLMAFQQFLTTEFSVENVLFYKAVNAIERTDLGQLVGGSMEDGDHEEQDFGALRIKIAYGKKVFDEFVKEGSRLNVNLPHHMQVQLARILDRNTHDIPNDQMKETVDTMMETYARAQNEIVMLMQNDPFRRFKATPEYLEIKRKIKSDDQPTA